MAGTLLAVAGAWFSIQLYKNLRTDIEELLPTQARSVIDLKEVSSRLEAIDNLAVLVFSKDTEASKRFIIDLAHRLESVPKITLSSIEYKIDRELQFFKRRQALFMELQDLKRIKDYVKRRISYERSLYNPLNIFSGEEIPEPKLDFEALKNKYQGKVSSYDRFPDGYYAMPDGTIRVLLAYMPGKTSSIEQVKQLKHAVVQAIEELNPSSYSSDFMIKYTGGVQDTLEEHEALIEDLTLSTVVVTLIVTLGMLIFYRSFLATMALLISLFMGTFWTFGLSYFLVGYLNANSAFLGSIVIGNGINFGIIFLARYLEERRRGYRSERAIYLAMHHTAKSTWTAALAAALAYGSLTLTGFRGFKQFGIIGLTGMLLCWLSSFTLLPAYLQLLKKVIRIKARSKPPKAYFTRAIAASISRFPAFIWILSLGVTGVAVLTFSRLSPAVLETDLSKLRNRESLERGSAYLSHYLDQIFQRYLSPVVILPHSLEDTRTIAKNLLKKKEAGGDGHLISSVQIFEDFIPKQQPEKIQVLKEIRELLPPRLVHRLSIADQKLISDFLRPEAFEPMSFKNMPELVIKKFTEKNGNVGRLILVEPPLTNETWAGENLIRFISTLRSSADEVAPSIPVAGTLPITADMFQAVAKDGPKATLFAFLAVLILVFVIFRSLRTSALVIFALLLGVTWLFGLILGFGVKINFLNFIALPITFGIGVDYGVNILQRYRQEGSRNILSVIQNAGGAVGLCSFSTIVGYTSLLIARNQGFVSFGILAVAGEITCVIAALVALPALLVLRDRKRKPRRSPGGALNT